MDPIVLHPFRNVEHFYVEEGSPLIHLIGAILKCVIRQNWWFEDRRSYSLTQTELRWPRLRS